MDKDALKQQRDRQKQLMPQATTPALSQRPSPKASPRPKSRKDRDAKFDKFRLPDGATFEAVYSVANQSWQAALSVGAWHGVLTGPGIHWCLMQLGQRWHRENLNQGE